MSSIVTVKGMTKRFGDFTALRDVSFTIESGSIVGLIGPNGAGKTTTLKSILGLTEFEGDMMVLGQDPRAGRHRIMERVCFVADVGVLPRWLRVADAAEYVAGVHPQFNGQRFQAMLADTRISPRQKVKQLSKGMVTQLHLALVMAIEADLLVLDAGPHLELLHAAVCDAVHDQVLRVVLEQLYIQVLHGRQLRLDDRLAGHLLPGVLDLHEHDELRLRLRFGCRLRFHERGRFRFRRSRILGGTGYWRYGVEQYAARLHAAGIPLALLPGDDKPDAELRALSTVTDADYDRLWSYLVEGGPENAANFLRHTAHMLEGTDAPAAPTHHR